MRLFLAFLLLFSLACHTRKDPLVIVLGIDGMDPKFVHQHLADLPNVRTLAQQGEFKLLQTTMPPQSPVAWSTFSTGLAPTQHGLFDFVYRDPHTMQPVSAMGELEPPAHTLAIGRYQIPLGSPHMRSFRTGVVFWKLLADAGIPVKVLRMPVNYPPAAAPDSLSGMGVPDMRGTFGTHTFFNNPPMNDDRALLTIQGPADPYLRDATPSTVTMTVDVDPFENVARFQIQDHTFILRAGDWSNWIPVTFFHSAQGIFRVYAKGFRPDFQVYITPVNFNPRHPDTTLSAPASYSAALAGQIGLFYTQGMPEDTSAYREGIFTRAEYLTQSNMVAAEQIRLLKAALTGFNQGFFFLHFSAVDQNSHMLWGKDEPDLLATYKLADNAIGWVMKTHPDARIIVMSDHGFTAFKRAVNLNAWLTQQGLKSSAYALGLNALYLSLAGRERNGSVSRGDAPRLLQNIASRLLALRDPANGAPVVTRVFAPHPKFQGDIEFIPDLIVGFAAGYRASWSGSMGDASGPVFSDNTDAWVGDHCMDPAAVPGLLISNQKSRAQDPGLKDLAPSLLHLFNVAPAPGMNGKVIY